MGELYLVRHAKAGERRLWTDDDVLRPLSKKGWKQSASVAKRLAKLEPTLLLSSRYVRCVQTLEPLAKRLGTTVEVDDRLTEEEPVEPVLELLREVPDGAVLCSHGDIIPATIQRLKKTGTQIRTPTDWRKASVWVLHRNKKGRIVHARVWPPPTV
jgi:8-oxo-dGTP diphosphatase